MKRTILSALICLTINLVNYAQNFHVVRSGNAYGFINHKGTVEITSRFTQAYPFAGGLAAVKEEIKWFFIDQSGTQVSGLFDSIISTHAEGVALAYNNDSIVSVNSNGAVVNVRHSEQAFREWTEGYLAVKENGVWGIIDTLGEYIIEPSCFKISDINEGHYYCYEKAKLHSYHHKKYGVQHTDMPDTLNDQDLLIPFGYSYKQPTMHSLKNQKPFTFVPTKVQGTPYGAISEGWAQIYINGGCSYFNKDGKLFPGIYSYCSEFQNGYATVTTKGGDFVLIDTSGKIVADTQYNVFGQREYGVVCAGTVARGQFYWGLLNAHGKTLLPKEYDILHIVGLNRIVFKKDGEMGIMNFNGESIFSKKDCIISFINGRLIINSNDKYGVIDSDGNYVLKPKYDFIIPVSEDLFAFFNGTVSDDVNSSDSIKDVFNKSGEDLEMGYINRNGKVVHQLTR